MNMEDIKLDNHKVNSKEWFEKQKEFLKEFKIKSDAFYSKALDNKNLTEDQLSKLREYYVNEIKSVERIDNILNKL